MNREILFRGKRLNDKENEWAYGSYVKQYDCDMIYFPIADSDGFEYEYIIPETVGQFTGLTDKNGKKIFEGDILETPCWYTNNSYPCVCIFAEEHRVESIQGFGLYHKINDSFELVQSDEWDEFKVIGNIHDNPELLKGGVQE